MLSAENFEGRGGRSFHAAIAAERYFEAKGRYQTAETGPSRHAVRRDVRLDHGRMEVLPAGPRRVSSTVQQVSGEPDHHERGDHSGQDRSSLLRLGIAAPRVRGAQAELGDPLLLAE